MAEKNSFSTARIALDAEISAHTRKALNALREAIAKGLGSKVSIEKLIAQKEYKRRWRDSSIPKSRKCPTCKITKVDRSRWSNKGVCLSCYRIPKTKYVDPVFASEPTYRIPKDSFMVGLTITDIVEDTGWSRFVAERAKTTMIVPHKHKAGYEKAYGKLTYAHIVYYRAVNLKESRQSVGISAKDFAKLIGWTESRQYRLERGDATLTTEEVTLICKFIAARKEP